MSQKLKVILSAGVFLATTVFANAVLSIDEVNAKITEMLAPFQKPNTRINLQFTDLEIDATSTRKLNVISSILKEGPDNTLNLRIDPLAYAYPVGGVPRLQTGVHMDLDLLKAFSQNTLNSMGNDAQEMIREVIKNYTNQYGEAVLVDAAVDEINKDAQGNIQSLSLHVGIKIDLQKLPADIALDSVYFTDLKGQVNVTLGGVDGTLRVDLNPNYQGFSSGQKGMKEWIEGLLRGEDDSFENIRDYIQMLNDIGDDLVAPKSGL